MCARHHVLACLLTSLSSSLPFVCVCLFLLCSSVEPAVCVCCTWLTCSRRAGCQQKPHHFTSPLSTLHHCQEDCLSTSKTHTGCTAGSSATEVVLCFVCMSGHLFHVCKALSDQLCLLTVPASIAWNTCSRRAGCEHHYSGTQKKL